MSRPSKEQMTQMTELIRRGATLLKEACSRCGGLQVKYRNRVLCVVEDNLAEAGRSPLVGMEEVSANLKELVLMKIQEASTLLSKESDIERQTQIASLLVKYMELVEKISKPSASK